MLVSMKKITTSFIPQQRLKILRIDFNHLDIASGITSPSVTRFFMPRTNTPRIEKIVADPSWDWFLSQKGNFGKGTHCANYLFRRVFMDYQDWSIPEFWPYELDGAKSEEDNNDKYPTVQKSGHFDKTEDDKVSDGEDKPDDQESSENEEIYSDKAKEGEIVDPKSHYESDKDGDKSEESDDENRKSSDKSREKSEKIHKGVNDDHEMVIANALDLEIRNYQTDDWSVYW